MNTLFEGRVGVWLRRSILASVVLFGVFLLVEVVSATVGLRYVGTGVAATNTISVAGHGELSAVPDIATFTYSVVSTKASVAAAQADATAKANATTAYLTSAGVAEKDLQTSGYAINPQYSYQSALCPQVQTAGGSVSYCPPGKQVLDGYEVRQTTTVKVRDTTKAGALLAGVGAKGASEVSGLSFTFDNPTGMQEQARDKAIANAKEKAEKLAGALGVSLVRVVSFNENGNTPMYDAKSYGMSVAAAPTAAPVISVGQNKTTDDVTITYEIR